jgi:mono/diheme cytochrome c family protein
VRHGCALLVLLGCSSPQRPAPPVEGNAQAGAAIVVDATRASSELSCAHCHASRAETERGLVSPGPPWPGTLQRTALKDVEGMDAATAADRCGATYQARGLTAQERADVAAFLGGEGAALSGQPMRFPGAAASHDEVLKVAALPGDTLMGERVFARACERCHLQGPGYRLSALMASSRTEVLLKVMEAPANPRAGMPHFPAGRLSAQDLADVAVYVNPQN